MNFDFKSSPVKQADEFGVLNIYSPTRAVTYVPLLSQVVEAYRTTENTSSARSERCNGSSKLYTLFQVGFELILRHLIAPHVWVRLYERKYFWPEAKSS